MREKSFRIEITFKNIIVENLIRERKLKRREK